MKKHFPTWLGDAIGEELGDKGDPKTKDGGYIHLKKVIKVVEENEKLSDDFEIDLCHLSLDFVVNDLKPPDQVRFVSVSEIAANRHEKLKLIHFPVKVKAPVQSFKIPDSMLMKRGKK
jgi:hypothetical protein